MARLFISYPRLDQWVEEQEVSLSGDQLTTADGRTYQLVAAVCFVSLAGGEADPHELLGKVKTEEQLAELKAEHYQDSVLLGEVAYQVMEGFIGEPV